MKNILLISFVILSQLNISAQSAISTIPSESTGLVKFNPSQINNKYSLDTIKNWLMGADLSLKKQLFNSYFDVNNIDLALMFDNKVKEFYEGDIYNFFVENEDFKIEAIVFSLNKSSVSDFKKYLSSNVETVYGKKQQFVFKNKANIQFGVFFDKHIVTIFKLLPFSTYVIENEGYSFEEKEIKKQKNELKFYKTYFKQLSKKRYDTFDSDVVDFISSKKADIILYSDNLGEMLSSEFPYPLTAFNKEIINQRYLIGLNFSEGEISVDFELHNPIFWNKYSNLLSPLKLDEKMFDFLSEDAILIQTSNINTNKSYDLLYNHLLPLITDVSVETTTGLNGLGAYTQWMMQFFDSKKLANMFTGHSVTAYLPSKSITKVVEVVSYDEDFNEVVKNEEQEVLIPTFTSVTGLNKDEIMKSFFEIGTNVFDEFTYEKGMYILDIKSLVKRFDSNFNFNELQMNDKFFVKFYEGYMITSSNESGVDQLENKYIISEENKKLINEYPYLISVDLKKTFNEVLRYNILPGIYNELASEMISKTKSISLGIKTSDEKMSLRLLLKMNSQKNALITINEMFNLLRK